MAGAGYKLFNTGDVLTAQQVNEYLMQQTTMVFASAAARTSALSGVLAEGMVSYLQDTNTLEVYDGSAWVGATGDITGLTAGTGISISSATGPVPTITNSVATTFDALGDLVVGTGADTFAKLTVGNSGETIVADSSQTTGLGWQGNFAAGKNKIINGDMNIWQRGTTFNSIANNTFTADRYNYTYDGGGTFNITRQNFTAGTAPVSGYESAFFLRSTCVTKSTSTVLDMNYSIEDVRTLSGQTATLSFWAKADSNRTAQVWVIQIFGGGGSADVYTSINATSFSVTTSWQRFSFTANIPSMSGKTIGTNSMLRVLIRHPIATGSSLDLWGLQMEAGSVATAFQTATGTLAGEYLACARYYQKSYNLATAPGTDTNDGLNYSAWSQAATTTGYLSYEIVYPVRMRTAATVVTYDVADASGKVSRVTPAGTDQNGLTPNTAFGNEARILIQSSSGNSHSGLALHWTASAEL